MAYEVLYPAGAAGPFLFASPHSGRFYPDAFRKKSVLDAQAIRSSEDAFVDELISAAPQHGIPLLLARFARAYVDLNRSPDELDPALFEGLQRKVRNPRIASGLGVIPRVVANSQSIYRGKLPFAEAEARLNEVWHPYHATLERLLSQIKSRHGQAILVDFHSMPADAMRDIVSPLGKRPHIVIGDRFGSSAHRSVTEHIANAFKAQGFDVGHNTPFAGAFITQRYGRPSAGQHAIQVEIDRSLYMDEARISPHEGFEALKERIGMVIERIATLDAESDLRAAE